MEKTARTAIAEERYVAFEPLSKSHAKAIWERGITSVARASKMPLTVPRLSRG